MTTMIDLDTRPTLSLPLFLLSQFLIVLTIALPSFPLRRVLLFPPIFALHIYLLQCKTSLGPAADFAAGTTIAIFLFTASTWILIHDPQDSVLRDDQSESAADKPFLWRLGWAIRILYSPRGIGWSFCAYNAPRLPRALQSRGPYLINRLLRAAISFLVLDAAQSYMHWSPTSYFMNDTNHIGSLYHPRLGINLLAFCLTSYYTMEFYHNIAALVMVGSGICDPVEWPDLYGSIYDAYTIGRFWG